MAHIQSTEESSSGDGWYFCLKTFSIVKIASQFSNTSSTTLTNFVTDEKGQINYANGNNIFVWNDKPCNDISGGTTNDKKYVFTTKDYDFDNPSIRKKIHKIYVTYKMPTNDSKILLTISKDGKETFAAVTGVSNYNPTDGFLRADATGVAEIKPSTSLTCYSLQLKFNLANMDTANVENFEINDISIVYRNKTVK